MSGEPGAQATAWACSEQPFPICIEDQGYLLVDPFAAEHSESVPPLIGRSFEPRNWGQERDNLPQLIELAHCSAGQRAHLYDILLAEQRVRETMPLAQSFICGHLRSELSVNHVIRCLSRQMLVLPLNYEGSFYTAPSMWRFHDPRVFAHLNWLLPRERLARLLGPIGEWNFPYLGGWYQCQRTLLPLDATHEEVPLHASGLMEIDIDLWRRVQRIAMINRVMTQLELPAPQTYANLARIAHEIEAALMYAINTLHWSHPDDACGYAEMALRHGAAFRGLPGVVAIFQQQQSGQGLMRFADALTRLSAQERDTLQLPVLDEQ